MKPPVDDDLLKRPIPQAIMIGLAKAARWAEAVTGEYLAEREERLGHLQGNLSCLEVGPGREVRPGTIPQRPGENL